MKQITVVFVTGLLLASASLLPCRIVGAQTQNEMNLQAVSDFNKADKELNVVYKKLLALLSQDDKAKLIKAQRAWLSYRDAEMSFAATTYSGGTMSPLVRYNTAIRVTKSRLKDIQGYLKDYSHR